MQSISQCFQMSPPLDELPHNLHIVLFARLKSITIMQNELVVLLRDVLVFDVCLAWLFIRR